MIDEIDTFGSTTPAVSQQPVRKIRIETFPSQCLKYLIYQSCFLGFPILQPKTVLPKCEPKTAELNKIATTVFHIQAIDM